jgi:hypothetical protein
MSKVTRWSVARFDNGCHTHAIAPTAVQCRLHRDWRHPAIGPFEARAGWSAPALRQCTLLPQAPGPREEFAFA